MTSAHRERQRGRESYEAREWTAAYEALSAADRDEALAADDLLRLARAAYMLGRDDHYLVGLERAHGALMETGETRGAAVCTWWIGHHLLFRGEAGPAMGWLARGRRLLEDDDGDCVERGYVQLGELLEHVIGGEPQAAHDLAAEIAGIGERFGDHDLASLAGMEQGHALVRLGRTDEGLRLVDETMVAVTTGELSPVVAGIVYCNTIAFCQSVYELRRAREWTTALTRWCEQQPDMIAHNGLCLVHRAELMTLGGDWAEALEELRVLGERFTRGVLNRRALGRAAYQRGEVSRLQGAFTDAEASYREATRLGWEPQPGLALMRLAQGNEEVAAAAIRRAVGETTQPLKRAALLPAYVEIMVASGDLEAARSACRELGLTAERQGNDALAAMSAFADGTVSLAEGDADGALPAARRAWHAWRALDAPCEAARARVLVGRTCRALSDDDAAALELEAARGVFEQLGAAPELARLDALTRQAAANGDHGLTDRELEVLRLVAAGESNREIAAKLVISEHTVARHLQNIFAKLNVQSRTAAGAYAFKHHLA